MFVFCSVPFRGHLNVILDAATEYWKRGEIVKIVILTWKNMPFDLNEFQTLPQDMFHILKTEKTNISGSTAIDFNWPRSLELLEPLTKWLTLMQADARPVEWIVYDFFCIEALLAANILRIPSVCSIPAVLGTKENDSMLRKRTFLNRELEKFLEQNRLDVSKIRATAAISDFFYVTGSEKQWIWSHPLLLDKCVLPKYQMTNYRFLSREQDTTECKHNENKPFVYLCLGTVVTGNLWNKNDSVKPFVKSLCLQVVKWCVEKRLDLHINAPGLPSDELGTELFQETVFSFSGVKITSWVDQRALLSQNCVLFVTHGGGNSVTEALEKCVPMLVVPFFGDQHICGEMILRSGFGLQWNLVDSSAAVESHKTDFSRRTGKLEKLLNVAHLHRENFKKTIHSNRDAIGELFCREHVKETKLERNRVVFCDGDLLFGSNVAREKFADSTICSKNLSESLCINQTEAPSTRSRHVAALIDHYNDVFRLTEQEQQRELAHESMYGETLRQLHRFYVKNSLNKSDDANSFQFPPQNQLDLWKMCCFALRFLLTEESCRIHERLLTLEKNSNSTLKAYKPFIHFVVHEDYKNTKNLATAMELNLLETLWVNCTSSTVLSRVRFYFMPKRKDKTLYVCNPNLYRWFQLNEPLKPNYDLQMQVARIATAVQLEMQAEIGAVYVQQRNKSNKSLSEKIYRRNKVGGVEDVIGVRFIHLWSPNLHKIKECLLKNLQELVCCKKNSLHDENGESSTNFDERHAPLHTTWTRTSEKGKVHYVYARAGIDQFVEFQIWPVALHVGLEFEHEKVYKAHSALSEQQVCKSEYIRNSEHFLQAQIDSNMFLSNF